ncbi:ABC transporter permease [Marinilabilia sp.]
MNKIWIITLKEFRSYFDSLMAYIMLFIFLGLSGFFTWLYGSDVFYTNTANLQQFFQTAYWTLFLFIPALTMKHIAEELKTGTIELLLTKPVSYWQVIFGKFLATWLLIMVSLALTLPWYVTIANLGPIDHGTAITGYLGLLLMSATYISIGIFTSSFTHNQIVAFLLALVAGIFFQILFSMLGSAVDGTLGDIFGYLDLRGHYDNVTRGIVDSRDLIYFISIIFLALTGAEAALLKKNLN